MLEETFPGTLPWLASNKTSEAGYGSILSNGSYGIMCRCCQICYVPNCWLALNL